MLTENQRLRDLGEQFQVAHLPWNFAFAHKEQKVS